MMKLFRRFKRWITQDYSKPVNDYGSHGSSKPDFKPEWGIIIPHTEKAQGAESVVRRDDQGRRISEYMYAFLMLDFMSFFNATRNIGGVFSAAKRLFNLGCNASLEPHKNAYNGKVGGFEILYLYGDELSREYAEKICEAFSAMFPDHNMRGLKPKKKGERGANNLIQAKRAGMEVALLSESFFIDNDNDWISPEEMAKFWNSVLQ